MINFYLFLKKGVDLNKANVLVLGISFKENCVDIRNSKVLDILLKLDQNNVNYDVFDPVVNQSEVENKLDIKLINNLDQIKNIIL